MKQENRHRPLNATISTVRLPMGVKERWRGITQEAVSLNLDGVLILHSLFHGARERRGVDIFIYLFIYLCVYTCRKHIQEYIDRMTIDSVPEGEKRLIVVVGARTLNIDRCSS